MDNTSNIKSFLICIILTIISILIYGHLYVSYGLENGELFVIVIGIFLLSVLKYIKYAIN